MTEQPAFYAKGDTVFRSPVVQRVDGGKRYTVGFPVCTVHEAVAPNGDTVKCLNCLAEGPVAKPSTEAIRLWNTRTSPEIKPKTTEPIEGVHYVVDENGNWGWIIP